MSDTTPGFQSTADTLRPFWPLLYIMASENQDPIFPVESRADNAALRLVLDITSNYLSKRKETLGLVEPMD